MHLRLAPFVVALALGVLATATPAAAERAALFLGSTAKGVDRPALIKIARAQAEAAGWSVTEPPLADGPLGDLVVCVSSGLARDCIPGHLDDNDVDRGIVISVGQEGKGTWVVNGWVFRRTGDLLVTDRRYCEGCKTEKLADTVRDLTATLVTEARARAKPTMIVARSKPAGAKVFVDDEEVGVAELEAPVYAGNHTVRFELEGHRAEVREVAIGDGETITVEVTLKPTAEPKPPVARPPGARKSKLVPISVMAGGGLLIIGGFALLAADEDPVQDGHQVASYTNTTLPAIGLFAAGAAVIGTGVWLFLEASSDERAPTVGLAPGGAWIGYTGRF